MGYWGWRPLILGLFISTWVAGCNVVTDHASPSTLPTTYPSVTLTIGRLASPRAAPTHAAVSTVVSSAGLPLAFDNPVCYETREDSRLCLGLISNPLNYAVTGVVVDVQYGALTEQAVIEQAILPPGGIAPYQAVFDTRTTANAVARPLNAVRSADDTWVTLTTGMVDSEKLNDGRYIVSTDVINAGDAPADMIRAVVTLLDSGDLVIGYRVLDLEGIHLEIGGDFPLRVLVAPQIDVDDAQVYIHVEGRKTLPE